MDHRAQAWFARRSSRWWDWMPSDVLEAKLGTKSRISVVVPARNEERTVAAVVSALAKDLMSDMPLIDELVVIDSDSDDATATVAAAAGATVYRASEVVPELGREHGKGEALWKSLFITEGDLLVFIDADLTDWGNHFITGLLGPLLADAQVQLVKGFYDRRQDGNSGAGPGRGGRVTELVARPLLSVWWPELAGVVQPLAGEWAARRGLLESLAIPVGYGVELSTLVDTAARYGLDSLAQVDLGTRGHRQWPDEDLAVMAGELLAVAERRKSASQHRQGDGELVQFVRDRGCVVPRERGFPTQERPPVELVRSGAVNGLAGEAW